MQLYVKSIMQTQATLTAAHLNKIIVDNSHTHTHTRARARAHCTL